MSDNKLQIYRVIPRWHWLPARLYKRFPFLFKWIAVKVPELKIKTGVVTLEHPGIKGLPITIMYETKFDE